MDPKGLIEHVVVSIAGWLVGISFGWITSYALASLWRKSNRNAQKYYPSAFLVPWRTFICGLFLVNLIPILPIRWFGLGAITEFFSVAHVVFWLTLIILFSPAPKETLQPMLRFLSWARTLAVFSVILTTHFNSWAGGGLGFAAREQLMMLKYDGAWAYFWWIIASAFVIDVAIAIGQIFVYHYSTFKKAG